MKIEYLRLASGESIYKRPNYKNDGAKRHPQLFNLQSSIFNLSSSGFKFKENFLLGVLERLAE